MASLIKLTLTGAAAIADSLKYYQVNDKTPSAASIGKEVAKEVANEVGQSVTAALDDALATLESPSFHVSSLREQILGRKLRIAHKGPIIDLSFYLANADATVDLYQGPCKHFLCGITLTVTGTGDEVQAAVIAKDHTGYIFRKLRNSLYIVRGPLRGSDIEALVALQHNTKLALTQARSLSQHNLRYGAFGFDSFGDLRTNDMW
jgi:hypothetical protein